MVSEDTLALLIRLAFFPLALNRFIALHRVFACMTDPGVSFCSLLMAKISIDPGSPIRDAAEIRSLYIRFRKLYTVITGVVEFLT